MRIVKVVVGFVFGLAIAGGGVFLLLWLNADCPHRPTVALGEAVRSGNVQQVKAHLFWDCLYRSTVEEPLDKTGIQLIHVAAINNDTAMIEMLLARGANINSLGVDGYGDSPLHAVIRRHHEPKPTTAPLGRPQSKPSPARTQQTAEFLILKGADVNLRNAQGLSPLEMAQAGPKPMMIECLKRHGAK